MAVSGDRRGYLTTIAAGRQTPERRLAGPVERPAGTVRKSPMGLAASPRDSVITFQKILIIGAPRSGTNLLRDLMARLDGAGTWPCDEINHVWRHGNIRHPSDALPPGLARPEVRRYIAGVFTRLAARRGLDTVIEKTCANSLRVPFVDRVIDDAKYVFIVRDGVDAAASAAKRWHAGLDLGYRLRKARFVPPTDVPYYLLRFLGNQLQRLGARGRPANTWGPVFDGMAEAQRGAATIGVCARQWRACVEAASAALAGLPASRVHRVRYEDFVGDPVREFRRIAEFAGKPMSEQLADHLRREVSGASRGRGRTELTREELDVVLGIEGPALAAHGYA